MRENLQNQLGARSASEALSKMKENRQRQTSTTQSTQTNKPHISQNAAPRKNNNNGCGWFLWFAVFFVFGVLIFSML